MKKYLFILLALAILTLFATQADAQALRYFTSAQLAPDPQNGYCLTTNGATSTWTVCTGGSGTTTSTIYLASSSPSWGVNQLTYVTGAGTIAGTSSPVVGSITATSSGANSFAGNVGIGTTSPSAKLTIEGDMRLTGRFADAASSTGALGSVLTATANGTAWLATSSLGISSLFTDGGATTYLTSTSDNIAIGSTTSPVKMYVEGTDGGGNGYVVSALHNTASSGRAELALSAGADQPYYSGFVTMSGSGVQNYPNTMEIGCGFANCGINFWSDGFLQGRMGTTGNLGLGTTTGLTSKLTLQAITGGQSMFTVASTTGATMFTILGNSNVGIGSSTPASALGVTGTTTATGFRAMGVTASRALFTNATNDLVPTGASAALLNSLTDETGTGLAVFNTTPTFATSAISPIWQSTAADTADTGAVRLGNAEIIGWEASPAGTDVTLTVNTSETLVLAGGGFTATGGTATFGTLAGALDAGGATSFEIPNGANGTVDAIGEITLDTTDNQLVIATSTVAAAAAIIPTRQQIGAFLISSSSQPFTSGFTSGIAIPFKIQADGYTVTDIFCDIDGGTSIVINFDNGTGNTSTVTCDTDGASLAGVAAVGSNRVVAAGAVNTAIETGTVTGVPDYLRVSVFGLITRE